MSDQPPSANHCRFPHCACGYETPLCPDYPPTKTSELAAVRQSPPPVEVEQGRYKGPRDVFCPSCGAVAGERCFSDKHHMERLKLSDAMNAKVDESASPRAQDDTPFFCERCGREFAQKPEGDCPDPGCGGEVFKGTP
jgi:hypothetical protein